MCVCEHRVTYWVFAKSFSPKKVCLKTFCGCRWFNEWLLPKENDKVCFLATRTQVFFLRKIQMFSLLLVLHSRLFKFFCNNLFPLSLIISYFIISIVRMCLLDLLSLIYAMIFRGVIIVYFIHVNCLQNSSKCLCVRHVKFLPHCTLWQKENFISVWDRYNLILDLILASK